MPFRTDINGLRAIAVISVVLFHFGARGFGGGFTGVDVFFVISGFLMTGIIFRRIDRGQFSLSGFYMDRGRRIVPALFVLCVVLLILSWFFLPPQELKALGKYTASSITFLSNFVFARQDGYFDQTSHSNWLLHTWSLSVEWQFYIGYPLLILALVWNCSRTTVRTTLCGIAVLSFLLSAFGSQIWPNSSFYLLPARAWELLAGGMIFLFPIRLNGRSSRFVAGAGILLILAGILTLRSSDAWPGWLAVIPVAGTSLVIAANVDRLAILSSLPFQFLGKTSYSIYLWHWPVVVALRYLGLMSSELWAVSGMLLSIALGGISYRFVERAVPRQSLLFPARRPHVELLAGIIALAGIGAGAFVTDGVPQRMTATFNARTAELVMPMITNGWCFYSVDTVSSLSVGSDGFKCSIGDPKAKVTGLLFGDSFAAQYDPFWDKIGKTLGLAMRSVTTNWCYPTNGSEFTGPYTSRSWQQCLLNRRYLNTHIADYDFVIFGGQWGNIRRQGKLPGVLKEIQAASKQTRLVILMSAPTTYDSNISSEYEASLISGRSFNIENYSKTLDVETVAANAALESFSRQFDNVIFVGRDQLFRAHGRSSDVTEDGVPFSWDGQHISVYGAGKAASTFKETRLYHLVSKKMLELQRHTSSPKSGIAEPVRGAQ